ncbi:alcohol dehydrogenase catalytic domain-containing protein [Chlorobium sp. N1]|uniref:alcohol dehydrogenase catalytic domain-containing protein n=1 Tax=Chlorobium sp. N1 TaxID=2491138 RepID=UPI00103DB2DD|nr:alcohol dehydrogenase catalytic domain-containing protein [Chlorobium sp. N1]TCD47474.1 alcohol dehydrogenase [Chlorobium sp. N1]
MKALVLNGVKSFSLLDRPLPVPGEGEVLMRVAAAAICRTDAKMWASGHRDLVLPRILGHEVVGSLREDPGRLYAVWPGTACGNCSACRQGRQNLCREMRITGFHRDGGFAGFMAVPRTSLVAVPDGLPASTAALAEPLACAVHAVRQAAIASGERVLIYGGGTLGHLLGLACAERGARVGMIDPDKEKLHRGRGLRLRRGISVEDHSGADAGQVDVALNATSSPDAFMAGVGRLKPGGRFCLFSGLGGAAGDMHRLIDELHYRELLFVGSYGCTAEDMREALRLLSKSGDDLRFLIERTIALDEVPSAMERVLAGKGFRLVVA